MSQQTNIYGVVHTKTPREVVLLNTTGGCSWRLCTFCDYCGTFSRNARQAEEMNAAALNRVTGQYGTLQVICSANFAELPIATLFMLRELCINRKISKLIVETHWMYREHDSRIRKFFEPIQMEFIYGIETFDFRRREIEWCKGYGDVTVTQLKPYADAVNLLIGVEGQDLYEILADIHTALTSFKKVYVYAFEPNDTPVRRDWELVDQFYNSEFFRANSNNPRLEILDGLDRRAPDDLGCVGVGPHYK